MNAPQQTPQQAAAATAQRRRDDLRKDFAPFGRLIKCELVNTLDSLVPTNSPIVGFVCEDLYHNGKLIIPAKTEVHSYITGQPKLDANGVGRIFDTNEWVLVMPAQAGGRINGREWRIKARAMDRRELVVEPDGRVRAWDINDLAPGLIGSTISTLNNEEIKLFASAFLGSAASTLGESLQQREAVPGTFNSTQIAPTARNAAIGGVGAGVAGVMKTYADRISEEISQRGFYVRVTSGKNFYLYIEQTLDPRDAAVGLSVAANASGGEKPAQDAGVGDAAK
jgi:hypothetical protein